MSGCSGNCNETPNKEPSPSCLPVCGTGKCKCDCGKRYGGEDLRMLLRVGTDADYEPFEFVKNGEITGFEIELLQLIAERLRFRVEFVVLDFGSLLYALNTRYIDAIASGMSPGGVTSNGQERTDFTDFSDIFYTSSYVLLTRNDVTIDQLDHLNGLAVGAQSGTLMLAALEEFNDEGMSIEIHSEITTTELIVMLQTNEVQAVLLIDSVAANYLSQNPSFRITGSDFLGLDDEIAFGLPKGSSLVQKFNALIEEFRIDGTLALLEEKWFEE